jgi:hypothetical protein
MKFEFKPLFHFKFVKPENYRQLMKKVFGPISFILILLAAAILVLRILAKR